MVPELKRLLEQVEEKLEWGSSAAWQNKDFENLSQRILNDTGVSLSESTLRRIWGKVEYNHMPNVTTLDAIAKFAGYGSWRNFQKSIARKNKIIDTHSIRVEKPSSRYRYKVKGKWIFGAIIIVGLLGVFAVRNNLPSIEPDHYSFSSEPLTHDIPNSVIFKYDASMAPSDSVFIQQSWDERTRAVVDKNRHTYTCVYYEPGFYQAKLVVDLRVVKEHQLLIPTNGWLGMIDNKPIPVYLTSGEFLKTDMLQLNITDILNKNINVQLQPPVVKYYNVGNFDSVSVSDFSFSTVVRNEYKEGAAACQFSYILLVTDGAPIGIPLSTKGCISELTLQGIDTMVSGKNEDLSGFGVDFKEWIEVTCKSMDGRIRFIVNDKEVYSLPQPSHPVHILGIGYIFVGTGAVKDIHLAGSGREVFAEFNN